MVLGDAAEDEKIMTARLDARQKGRWMLLFGGRGDWVERHSDNSESNNSCNNDSSSDNCKQQMHAVIVRSNQQVIIVMMYLPEIAPGIILVCDMVVA